MYDVLVAAVQPRPIALVSTMGSDGSENLAPFSFFMAGGSSPPSLMYSPALNAKGEPKDSLRNVEETSEFVVNLVTRTMADAMNAASYEYPAGFDEWQVAKLTPIASEVVKPRRVQESPIHFECRLFQIVRHGEGPTAANYVIGEVVRVHVLEQLWGGTGIVRGSFRPISRMGGPEYLDTDALEIFSMPRPTGAEETGNR
jgi:flavin reductase (DIM6/NTAB) family NADH-FMN oxidoreductase RutF